VRLCWRPGSAARAAELVVPTEFAETPPPGRSRLVMEGGHIAGSFGLRDIREELRRSGSYP
jgi:hypothetical protein